MDSAWSHYCDQVSPERGRWPSSFNNPPYYRQESIDALLCGMHQPPGRWMCLRRRAGDASAGAAAMTTYPLVAPTPNELTDANCKFGAEIPVHTSVEDVALVD